MSDPSGSPPIAGPAGGAGTPMAAVPGHDIRVGIFGRTDVGQIREHNEDNFIVADLTRGTRGLLASERTQAVGPRGTLIGVCDGMGGAAAGEVASQLAVDIIFEKMTSGDPPRDRDDLARRLVRAVEDAGQRIFADAKADRARRGMGTTATIAALIDDHLFLAQVGDSRGYLLRGDKLVQVTRDQSLVNQLIEAGQLTEQEAETFEHNNIILQALGTAETVQVDLTYVRLCHGDTLMLCSDGLSGMVRFDEIRQALTSMPEPLDACRVLTEQANQAGGHDNITVIVARFEGSSLPPPSTATDLRYAKYPLPEEPVTSTAVSTVRESPMAQANAPATAPPPAGAPARDAAATPHTGVAALPVTIVGGPEGPQGPSSGRLSDHGPSASKVTHTMVPGQLDDAAMAAIQSAVAAAASAHAAAGPTGQPAQAPMQPGQAGQPGYAGPAQWQPQPAPMGMPQGHVAHYGGSPGASPAPSPSSEPFEIPYRTAPAWMVAAIVLFALVIAFVAGWYLLR